MNNLLLIVSLILIISAILYLRFLRELFKDYLVESVRKISYTPYTVNISECPPGTVPSDGSNDGSKNFCITSDDDLTTFCQTIINKQNSNNSLTYNLPNKKENSWVI